MSERPLWVKEIQRFLSDTIIDEKYGWPKDDSADDLLDEIETAVNDILCKKFGHTIEFDQCMLPEHRYCIWCNKLESDVV